MKDKIIKFKENLTYYIKSLSGLNAFMNEDKIYKSSDWRRDVKLLPFGSKILIVLMIIIMLVII